MRLFLLQILALASLCSCASMTYESRHQSILVQSNPPGAKILVDGKQVGVTPDIIELRKKRVPQIEIVTPSENESINIATKFDWGGSFARNFVFLNFAPAGWLVDWITGSTWVLKDPPTIELKNFKSHEATKQEKIAIAPPYAETLAISDRAAQIWDQQLQTTMKNRHLLHYSETVRTFALHHFDFDEKPNQTERYSLYRDLGLTHLFESTVVESGTDDILLKGHLISVYSATTSEDQVMRISKEQLKEIDVETWSRRNGWIHLIPNTVGIDFSSSDTEVDTAAGDNHKAQPASGASTLDKILYYVGAIDISRQNPPRDNGPSRWRLQFAPSIFGINQRLSFPDFKDISSSTFHYMQLSAGLGGETGWQKGLHYIYLNVIPMYGVQYLAWQQQGQDESLTLGGFELRSEFGYRYYWNRHWSTKFFTKSTKSYSPLWNSAIHRIAPAAPEVATAIDTSAGIAFSYTFDYSPELHWTKK